MNIPCTPRAYGWFRAAAPNELKPPPTKTNDRLLEVDWSNTGEAAHAKSGKLTSFLELRDVDVRRESNT